MSPNPKPRVFEDKPAVLTSVPLWVGVYGATGSGKTYSALRLATGMQRVTGGDIHMLDTEARRALHYARDFKFRHVEFAAPFSPLDYLAAVEHCVSKGAKVLVIDSMSHEHEGPGGVLEWQAAEEERLAKAWNTSRDKAKMSAWQVPKQARRRMINTLLQLPINIVFCFRAKEKLKVIPGRSPEPLGFMPIAGEELAYEMTTTALLLPGANGVATWSSQERGENIMIKRPEQFRALIKAHGDGPLDENMGEAFARWAAGESVPPPERPAARVAARIAAAKSVAEIDEIARETKAAGVRMSKAEAEEIKALAAARREAITAAGETEPAQAPAETVDATTGEVTT